MFNSLINIFTGKIPLQSNFKAEKPERVNQYKLQIATAAIFVEMAKADGQFSLDERRNIVKVLEKQFNLESVYVDELIEFATSELKDSVSLYEFSSVLNENFSFEDKFELLKNLWRLIYTDERLDKYEDHLIKVIGGMLNMEHRQIINTKMLVREELGLK